MIDDNILLSIYMYYILVYCVPSCVHGVCVATNTCVCGEGYEGDQCSDIGKNNIKSLSDDMPFIVYSLCDDNPCSNGGSCQYHAGSHICTCTPQYTGAFCDIELPTTTTTTTTTNTTTEGVNVNIGAIVGGVIGGVVGIALLVAAIIVVVVVVMMNLRVSGRKKDYEERHEMKNEAPHQNIYTSN